MYFMKFVGPIEQGAISYVGHLYTTIFIMGYAYCKGVQILVANQVGANALHKVERVDHAMITLLAMAMFLLLLVDQFGLTLLSALLNTPEAIEASWDYLSFGKLDLDFSFLGCGMLAMYSGIERTKILAVAIASMSLTNIFLNWVLFLENLVLSRWEFGVLRGLQTLQKLFPCSFYCWIVVSTIDSKTQNFSF